MKNTYLFGASGHGKVIKEILAAREVKVEAFIDDNLEVNECAGNKVMHKYDGLSPVIVSIGENRIRRTVVERLIAKSQANDTNLIFDIAIHPSAVVSPSAKIGEGSVVMAGAVINADAVIGKHCIINTGASVDHECIVEDFCHVAPHATLCGKVHLGEGTIMGAASCAIPCVSIGCWCTIGAGAAVINDIADNMTVVGVPAKPIINQRLVDDNL